MSLVINHTKNSVTTLQMNRAEKLNALNRDMYAELTAGFRDAQTGDSHVIVLKGAEGIFTAGNDLSDFAAAVAAGERFDSAFLLMEAMLDTEVPIVAAVDGPAIGIGTTLLFHCDLVYASPGASFHAPFADLGVCPEFASSETFPAMLGDHRAAQMLLLGEPLSATDAERFGLVNELVDSEALDQRVGEVATKLAAKPLDALKTSRRLLHARRSEYREIIKREGQEFGRLMQTDEFKSNLERFLSKKAS
jgi:enoyl-CoA hydratase/carnithine racemase